MKIYVFQTHDKILTSKKSLFFQNDLYLEEGEIMIRI